MIKETRLWKNQVSSISINGIPYIILPNTLLNHIAWDIQWSDVYRLRMFSTSSGRYGSCPVELRRKRDYSARSDPEEHN